MGLLDNEKRNSNILRAIFWILVAVALLSVLDFWLPKAPGADFFFSAHRQPDEGKHTPWYLCADNLSTAPQTLRLSDIYRAAAGNIAIYDPGKLRNVMRHKPRAKWLRALGIAGAATAVIVPFAGANEIWANAIGPVVSGGVAIAAPAIEANQQFEVGIEGYWTEDRLIGAGDSHCARVMSAKSRDTLTTFTAELRDEPLAMFHEAQQETVELVYEPPVITSLKVVNPGRYALPDDEFVNPPVDSCRPSAVVVEDGVLPCPWVD